MTWGALSGCTIGCRPRGSSATLQCFSQNADITGCPESRCRCSLLKSQTWCVKRAMLQPLGLPLCLPSHFLYSIRLNTFFHPVTSSQEIPPPQGEPCCSPPASPPHQYSFLTLSLLSSMSSTSSSIDNSLSRVFLWEDGQENRERFCDFWKLSRNPGPWLYPAWKMRFGVLSQEMRRFLAILFTGRPPRSIVLFPSETRARVFTMGQCL